MQDSLTGRKSNGLLRQQTSVGSSSLCYNVESVAREKCQILHKVVVLLGRSSRLSCRVNLVLGQNFLSFKGIVRPGIFYLFKL